MTSAGAITSKQQSTQGDGYADDNTTAASNNNYYGNNVIEGSGNASDCVGSIIRPSHQIPM